MECLGLWMGWILGRYNEGDKNYKYGSNCMAKKVISKVRKHKVHGQKIVTAPKQEETKKWEVGTLVEIREVELK